jgi:tetratricopeptide (TPR) repeat protein
MIVYDKGYITMGRFLAILISMCLWQMSLAQGIYTEEDITEQGLFIQANQYKLLAKYDKAIEIYKQIIELDPVNSAAFYDLSRVQLSQENYDEALKSIKRATTLSPDNVWYLLAKAEIEGKAEDCTAAAQTLVKVIQLKEDYDLYQRLFKTYVDCEDANGALKTIERINQNYGSNITWLDEQVNILLLTNRPKDAVKAAETFVKENNRSIEGYERLANVYYVTGRVNDAQSTLNKIRQAQPYNEYADYLTGVIAEGNQSDDQGLLTIVKDPRLDIDQKIKSIIPILQSSTDPNEINLLHQAADILVADYPKEAKAHAILGDILMIKGMTDEATQSFESTLELDKSNYAVWDQLLYAYMVDGSYDKLISSSEDALDYYPNLSGPYIYHAIGQYESGSQEVAQEYLEEFRFIGSKEPHLQDLSYIIESKIKNDQGDTEAALNTLNNYVIGHEVSNPQVFDLLGDLYLQKGDKKAAAESWQKALKLGGAPDLLNAKIQSI